jgi:hypothetical protein
MVPAVELQDAGEVRVHPRFHPVVQHTGVVHPPAHVVGEGCGTRMPQPKACPYRTGGVVGGMEVEVFISGFGAGGFPVVRRVPEIYGQDAGVSLRQLSGAGQPAEAGGAGEQQRVFGQLVGVESALVVAAELEVGEVLGGYRLEIVADKPTKFDLRAVEREADAFDIAMREPGGAPPPPEPVAGTRWLTVRGL